MPDSSAAPDVLCRRIENAIGIIGLRVRPNGVDLAPALTSSPCPEPDDVAKFASILITAVVATRWICADLAWPIQAASVVGFAVLFTGIAELVRGES